MGLILIEETKGNDALKNTQSPSRDRWMCCPIIKGRAYLTERTTEENMKHVEVSILARGRADGKHPLHIYEAVFYEPCSAISAGTVN